MKEPQRIVIGGGFLMSDRRGRRRVSVRREAESRVDAALRSRCVSSSASERDDHRARRRRRDESDAAAAVDFTAQLLPEKRKKKRVAA